jgi:hypothetical protein
VVDELVKLTVVALVGNVVRVEQFTVETTIIDVDGTESTEELLPIMVGFGVVDEPRCELTPIAKLGHGAMEGGSNVELDTVSVW